MTQLTTVIQAYNKT